ncbi:MAG: MBL fold metallo-hydrolase [Bacteroidia bacterium]|nr:MBL fold metallo-hydrolase [Bacteroidia bacterium]
MKIQILGSGTSTGVPQIGCRCAVCSSTDERDRRLRASALVKDEGGCLLMDCGPDFRQQMLAQPFEKIDGVLITHEHYDHIGGLDDLRPFSRFGAIPVYAERSVGLKLSDRMPYCFVDKSYPGVPNIYLKEVVPYSSFTIASMTVVPIRVNHGHLPIVGYRINKMAYITDMLTMPEESYEQLSGLDVLIVNALRTAPHQTHQHLKSALELVERLRPKQTFLIHMSHDMGLHAEVERELPPQVHLAYDGLEISC